MRWYKVVLLVALCAGLSGIAFTGFRQRKPPPTKVQVTEARKASIVRVVAGAGKLQAATTVKISSNLSGDLVELRVREGDRVTQGQVLGKIDPRRFEASARQAQAAASAAKAEIELAQIEVDRSNSELVRTSALVDRGAASQAELEKVRSDHDAAVARIASAKERYAQAQAAHDEAQTALGHTVLTSPIDGTVIQLSREVGERVRGSDFSEDVVMVIAALSAMEVKIEVGEHEVVHLGVGQRADVTVDAIEGQSFEGKVLEIAQNALIKNPGTEAEVTTFPVTVALSQRPPGALPGMSASVRIAAETHDSAVVVPLGALTVRSERSLADHGPQAQVEQAALTSGGGRGMARVVFVVDNESHAKLRRVKTGIASDTDLEIVDGLSAGEKVVEGPYRTLAKELEDGDVVNEKGDEGTKR